MDLQDKVVVVTGAAGGIGRAIVEELRDRGAAVVAADRDVATLDELGGDRLLVRRTDVTSPDDVAGLVSDAVGRFGTLTGIVNNAGVLVPGNLADLRIEDFQRIFDVNVKGTLLGCKSALPALLAGGGGSIVNFGSINSLGAEKELTAYCASKGAVLMMTRAIALDYAAQGVRANTVCPGFVDTPLNVPHYEKLGGRAALEAGLPDFQPIGRAILPHEIAQSVAFLLSDASSAITGTAFVVDGGVLSKA